MRQVRPLGYKIEGGHSLAGLWKFMGEACANLGMNVSWHRVFWMHHLPLLRVGSGVYTTSKTIILFSDDMAIFQFGEQQILVKNSNERVVKRKKNLDTNGPFCDDKLATICSNESIFICIYTFSITLRLHFQTLWYDFTFLVYIFIHSKVFIEFLPHVSLC